MRGPPFGTGFVVSAIDVWLSEYHEPLEAALARPLAVVFAFMQAIQRRNGIEAGAADSAEQDILAELEAELEVKKCRGPNRAAAKQPFHSAGRVRKPSAADSRIAR